MTRTELIEMVGTADQAEYAMDILLKNVKESFIKSCINAELKSVEEEIRQLEAEGYISKTNGICSANYSNVAKLNGWHLTEEQEKALEAAEEKYYRASTLIYTRNRLQSMIAVR